MTATVEAAALPAPRTALGIGSADLRVDVVLDAARALEADELQLHFQPMVELATGDVVGVEGLVRWRHPDLGTLLPRDFLRATEDTCLVVELGASALEQACRAAVPLASSGGPAGRGRVGVNVSPVLLARADVPALVADALSRHDLPGEALLVEVTETAVLQDVQRAATALHDLRDLGVGVYLDDFGTGCSSLSHLKQLPVSGIKLDRSFVEGVVDDREDRAIATCVSALAQAVGVDCVAEGVETAEQRDVLARLGCEVAQGFLWAPALPLDELLVWLDTSVREPAQLEEPVEQDPVERRILGLHEAGTSVHTIAALLNSEGLRAPTGLRWHARSIARLLQGR